jgi:YaiO family outer membrane protein
MPTSRGAVQCRCALVLAFVLLSCTRAAAQDDVLAKARQAATSGHRADALQILEERLAVAPRDVDARLLYGLVLSWEGRYDDARPVLQQVLAQAPGYADARVALMNVEYWSGRSSAARELADEILVTDPGNAQARVVRERLTLRRWEAGASYSVDSFDDGTDPWHEAAISLTRKTRVGAVILRGNRAERFDEVDQLGEVDFYPRFRPGTYAYISAGVAPDPVLYPRYRVAFDLYQSLGRGFEVSGGGRYLDFEEPATIYAAALSKYLGNWMLTGKLNYIPGSGDLNSTSGYGGARRYFGGDGTSFVGVAYSHGFNVEEVRNLVDLATLHADTIRGEFDRKLHASLRLYGSASVSRQERASAPALRQINVTGGFLVLF